MVKGLAFLFPFAMESQREKKAFKKKIKNKAALLGKVLNIKFFLSFAMESLRKRNLILKPFSPSRWNRYGEKAFNFKIKNKA